MGKEQAMVEQHAADILQPFLDQLREARTAVANGDPEPMKALCSHSDDVSQCGFWGGVESGWAEVGERWDWVAAQFVPGPGNVTSDTAFLTATGDMAYGVFIERWWGQLASRSEPTEIMIRATLIFRREDGVWKAVHRHGVVAVAKAPPS
jgi:ketosteroid isomerase-like protein